MAGRFVAAVKAFANLIYPLHCASCERALEALDKYGVCEICRKAVIPNPNPVWKSGGNRRLYFSQAGSACIYDGVIKKLIHAFKYGNNLRITGFFSYLFEEYLINNPELSRNIDIVTFVPLWRSHLRERGFNQSKVLAAKVSAILKKPLVEALRKTIKTRHQNELSKSERLLNLKSAFSVKRPDILSGKKILLVDDVMTTSSTLNECSHALSACGTAEVRCLTLARGI